MAFFTMAWQSGTLCSWLVRLLPVTGKASSLPKNSSQGSALAPWNSSSKDRAVNSPTSSSTRSPYRQFRLSRARVSQPPWHSTRPFSAWTCSQPMSRSSWATRPSTPIRQGTA